MGSQATPRRCRFRPTSSTSCCLPSASSTRRIPERVVAEMLRVLRPGGRLVVTCPNRLWRWSVVVAGALDSAALSWDFRTGQAGPRSGVGFASMEAPRSAGWPPYVPVCPDLHASAPASARSAWCRTRTGLREPGAERNQDTESLSSYCFLVPTTFAALLRTYLSSNARLLSSLLLAHGRDSVIVVPMATCA